MSGFLPLLFVPLGLSLGSSLLLLVDALPLGRIKATSRQPHQRGQQLGDLLWQLAGHFAHQIKPIPGTALVANPSAAPTFVVESEPIFTATGRARPMLTTGRGVDTDSGQQVGPTSDGCGSNIRNQPCSSHD
ncbi:hypothetical protein D3C77_366330 [compost metagenome]